MSDTIRVHGLTSDNAILLLAAAEELGLDPSVVATSTTGGFDVPPEVAKKAGFDENGVPSSKAAKDAADEAAQREADQAERDAQAIDALRGDSKGSTVTPGETGATAKTDADGKPKRAPRKTAAKKAAAPAASKE